MLLFSGIKGPEFIHIENIEAACKVYTRSGSFWRGSCFNSVNAGMLQCNRYYESFVEEGDLPCVGMFCVGGVLRNSALLSCFHCFI